MRLKVRKMEKYRWLVWGILCFAYVIAIFHRMGMGVIRADMEETLNLSSMSFAGLGSIFFYVYMVMQIPAGILVDFFGVRNTAAAGSALAGAGSILFGLSPTIFMLFLGRFLVSAGVSVLFISILKIISNWFYEREFGTLTGLTNVVGSLGAILAQTPLVALVSMFTWRNSFVIIGVVGIVSAALCLLVVRNKPTDIGLPYVVSSETVKNKEGKANVVKVLIEVCKNPYTWPGSIAYAGFYGSILSLTGTWGPSYLMNVYGMSTVKAANYIIVIILGAATAGLSIGRISDRLSKRKSPMTIIGTVYLISWVILVVIYQGKPPVVILGVLFFTMGFSAATYVLAWACGKEVNNPLYAGISTAVVNSGGIFGAAVIPLIFGEILDKYSNILGNQQLYNKAFMSCLVSVAVGYAFLFFIKETNCRNIYNTLNHSMVSDKHPQSVNR